MHEAYLRLVDVEKAYDWKSRGHFFAAAAEAMRRILVDNARRKASQKHGGDRRQVDAELDELPTRMTPRELISLDEALSDLATVAPERAKLVTLRYFGGMTIEQAAEVLGISRVTAAPTTGNSPRPGFTSTSPRITADGLPRKSVFGGGAHTVVVFALSYRGQSASFRNEIRP